MMAAGMPPGASAFQTSPKLPAPIRLIFLYPPPNGRSSPAGGVVVVCGGDGGGEIVHADGDVSDAVERRGVGFGLGVGKRGDKDKGE